MMAVQAEPRVAGDVASGSMRVTVHGAVVRRSREGFPRNGSVLSQIGVVGAGTAGLAAAALLARAGHDVQVLERAPHPRPVGAGLLLQPTGIAVLERLGVLDEVTAGAARISEVVGTTIGGRRFMDLAYAGLGEGVHGL